MKVAILTANLNNFDTPVDPVEQDIPVTFHRFDDSNFPPVTGLTPRFQYRLPKLFGWQMFPDYDYYIWLDGSMTFDRVDCARWFIGQCAGYDMAVFKHPWRNSIQEEVDHIETELQAGKPYITSRYANGFHKEQLEYIQSKGYVDDKLFTSTAFVYKPNRAVKDALSEWFYWEARYWTCDQVVQPFVLKDLKLNVLQEDQYNMPYLREVSKHS